MMDVQQTDLAETTANLLGFHIVKLLSTDVNGQQQAGKDSTWEVANYIWRLLYPYLQKSPTLTDRLYALAESPGEAARQAVAQELRRLFEETPELRGAVSEVVRQSTHGGTVRRASPAAGDAEPLTGAQRNIVIGQLILLTIVMWFVLLAVAGRSTWLLLACCVVQGGLTGYFAKRLHVPRPFWLGAGAALPGNMMFILLAMVGYRPQPADGGPNVAYSRFVKILMAAGAAALPLFVVVLAAINPQYLGQLFTSSLGILLAIGAVAAYGIYLLSVGLGFWQAKARSGVGIAIVSTTASWSSFAVVWIGLLGPGLIRVIQICRGC